MKKNVVFLLISMSLLALISLQSGCSLPAAADDTAPTCQILYPAAGQAVTGEVNIMIGATDNDKVDHVDLYVDNSAVAQLSQVPYEYTWNTSALADNRDHYIYAAAYDKSGNAGYSPTINVRVSAGARPDTLGPNVSIIYPVAGTTFAAGQVVTITVDVNDDSGVPPSKVEFYIDGELQTANASSILKYNWDTSGYGDGQNHSIYVKAYDEAGNSGSAIVAVIVTS